MALIHEIKKWRKISWHCPFKWSKWWRIRFQVSGSLIFIPQGSQLLSKLAIRAVALTKQIWNLNMSIIKVQCIDCIRCMFLPVIFKVQSFQWVKLLLSHLAKVKCHTAIFFISFYGFLYILFIQYNSVICRPSNHTVGRPWAEIRTGAGRPRGRDTTPIDHHTS